MAGHPLVVLGQHVVVQTSLDASVPTELALPVRVNSL